MFQPPTPFTETATFALGCFWKPDALFGLQQGVVRTRVGYAGGSTESPGYRRLADHIETIQLEFDPQRIRYEDLLDLFFSWHTPTRPPYKRQYASAIFYHTPTQHQQALAKKEGVEKQPDSKVHTLFYPYDGFYLAELRHQKYHLQRHRQLQAYFREHYPQPEDFVDATATARVNGLLYTGSSADLPAKAAALNQLPAPQRALVHQILGLQ